MADVGGSRDSSSAPETTDTLRVRARGTEEAMLAARPPLPLVEVPRGGRPLLFLVVVGLVCGITGLSAVGKPRSSGTTVFVGTSIGPSTGDGALSLRGLISSGRMGDLGGHRPPSDSTFFHLVADPVVMIGDGLGALLIAFEVEIGVC